MVNCYSLENLYFVLNATNCWFFKSGHMHTFALKNQIAYICKNALLGMVFKAIQDKFKAKSGHKYLEDELKKPRPFTDKKGVSSIACIVDMDKFSDAEAFQGLRQQMGLKPNAVHVMGYKRGQDKHGMFSIPFCTDKDLGWNGSIENGDFSEFSGRHYDVLINYFTEDRLVLKLMSTKINARLRVGLKEADNDMNDLIFDCGLKDYKTFMTELEKYLKILKELK